MQRLHERSAKGTFIHDAVSWMHIIHRLYYPTSCTDSGYPLVVMVEPTQYRNSDHLVTCMLRVNSRSARFRKLLLNPLMRSFPVEVPHILIEHALQLLLVEDQQMVKAFLSHTPQETFADRIGSWSMKRRFENLDVTHCRQPSKKWPKFAIIITNQILWRLSKWCGFSELLCDPRVGRRSCHAYVDHLP
jgi:hypothetical protein